MSILFVTGSRYHPEDVRPNIVVPYAPIYGTPSVLDAVKLALGVQGLRPRMVKLEQDFSYHQLIQELWAKQEPFILVEHDIIPWPGAVQQLWTCPEGWCAFPYACLGELRAYLGCTKFDPVKLGECPLPEELLTWQVMDQRIKKTLMMRQAKCHMHEPGVTHLNFAHVRQTERILEHPQFWKEG